MLDDDIRERRKRWVFSQYLEEFGKILKYKAIVDYLFLNLLIFFSPKVEFSWVYKLEVFTYHHLTPNTNTFFFLLGPSKDIFGCVRHTVVYGPDTLYISHPSVRRILIIKIIRLFCFLMSSKTFLCDSTFSNKKRHKLFCVLSLYVNISSWVLFVLKLLSHNDWKRKY